MTIEELIKRLQQISNQQAIIVLSSDREGNDYSPLSNLYEGGYLEYNGWSGEVHEKGTGIACVVLQPIN